ncbi:TetR/AcrR family transcriptional regulator [Bailinhaonella thermotolerans]|uniref:TetR/AcrR family transcriptional regulator n=1 Tax=Bailinhaonella thermotolerans TaxID=1070861 RepID=A0A3A4AY20_9ACTN|nr:TetR/AcrR family transcriptional regulator [Bailinhaonella thermotolerans]RJL35562.1 TetR/AcrR family transcriptional regulator [Bailinhaonella thermotolerans]
MAPRRTAPHTQDRPLSLIEQARRDQLIQITIDLVSEYGYAATSLTRIAQTAGITKGAVLYHFASKDAVVAAAHERVLGLLVADVEAAIAAVPADRAPAAYVRRMVGHLAERPGHTRMLVGAITNGDVPDPSVRWKPLAALLQEARRARGLGPGPDPRTLAIIVGGAIDGIIGEHMRDPGYDAPAAAEALITMLETTLFA